MGYKSRTILLSSVMFIALTLPGEAYAREATASESTNTENAVVEYLDGATENTRGEDHRRVLKQALTDMLELPLKKLCDKNYPDWEMQPDSWSISVVLDRYVEPKRQDLSINDRFFDDLEKPEAQRAIRAWLDRINREAVASSGATRPRNTVEDYLNGAELQYETDDQESAIRQAFGDMRYESVKNLRKKRYEDDPMHPYGCPIMELLNHYVVPDPGYLGFDGDEFFRDVKKPGAQEMIQIWIDYLDDPNHKSGPPREERPR
jgi:hypothetical protein